MESGAKQTFLLGGSRPRGYGKCSKGETWLGWGRPRGRPRGYGNGDWWYGKWSKTGIRVARMRQASRLWKLQRGKGETWLRWGKTRGRPPHLDIHTISHAGAKNLLHVSICVCHPCAGAMLIFSVSFQFYRMIPGGNPPGSESKRCLPSPATHPDMQSLMSKKLVTLLNLCASFLHRGHANLLCIVPILSDDPQRESTGQWAKKVLTLLPPAQHQWHGWPLTIDIPLLAFFRPQHLGASVPMYCSPQHCRLAAACHTCTCPRRESTLGSSIPLTILS